MVKKIYYALSTKIVVSGCEHDIIKLLERIIQEPLPIAEFNSMKTNMPSDCREILDWLVDVDILQFSCKRYTCVYRWNMENGGGLCGGLDMVAPSSRIAYTAIIKYLNDLKTRNTIELVHLQVRGVPDNIIQFMRTCS